MPSSFPHRHIIRAAASLSAFAALSAAGVPPSIYWRSSPVPAGATAFFAGSFGNVSAPSAFLCADGTACSAPQPLDLSLAYDGSVAFPYPPVCARVASAAACAFRLCDGAGTCATTADPNSPDLWFALAHPAGLPGTTWSPAAVSPAGVPAGAVLVHAGDGGDSVLRLFGRSLAWAAASPPPPGGGGWECVPATARGANSDTVLVLAPGAAPLPAMSATCYESAFNLSAALPPGAAGSAFPLAQLRTPFGAIAVPLVVAAARPPAPALAVIDVDAAAGGDVAAALATAAATPGDKLVRLGPHAYALTSPLTVPNRTALAGAGAASSLVFSFNASAPSHSVKGAIVGAGDAWALLDFELVVASAPAGTPAVWMQPATQNFTARRLAISLTSANVSNALHIEGGGWEVADSNITQAGVCLWPPQSDNTDFSSSTTLLLHAATDGFFVRNQLLWQCSAFDMDVSSRIVFEDNNITCTSGGVIPHGNSVSFYDWAHTPSSQSFSFSHNLQTRPANNNRTDWAFHETLTTDGPGGWGAGLLGSISADGTTVVVPVGLTSYLAASGASAVVIAGPGAGQWRTVVARPNATAVLLSAPFDGHVAVGASRIAVVASVGGKIISGNSWRWGSVVQEFGTTLTGVFADNQFDNQNNAFADSGAVDGSLTGFGLCYGNEPQQMFFVEYTGNVMSDSNGISLHDASPNSECNSTYPGPYIRWAVIRGNSISGIAASSPGVCGTVNATNEGTSDLLVELNTFGCPPGNLLPGNGLNIAAQHSVVL